MLKGEDELGNGEWLSPDVMYETGQMTAMHMATLNDDVEGVQLLLRYGADPLLYDEAERRRWRWLEIRMRGRSFRFWQCI